MASSDGSAYFIRDKMVTDKSGVIFRGHKMYGNYLGADPL